MNTWNLIPILLLALVAVAFASGAAMVLLILRWRRQHREMFPPPADYAGLFLEDFNPAQSGCGNRPAAWLAVRSRDLHEVESAFGLNNPKPCTWTEGLAGEQKLFIAPPVNGWILILGSGLPDPADDVDATFRFLLDLSRKLGQVQYFSANPILAHHAWVHVESGRVLRAYAWAGQTLWNQGIKTRAELQLGLRCFHYLETPDRIKPGQPDVLSMNTEMVPMLAARWSLDPAAIDERVLEDACGIAGEPPPLY